MNKIKLMITTALTFVVLFAQVGNVAAAPLTQTPTTITGTIQTITTETTNGVTIVIVTLTDAQNVTQTVHISVDDAATLGLVTTNPLTIVAQNGQTVTIDSTLVISDTTNVAVNPISSLLATFFGGDASIIDGYHNDGFGFGVIAQALWMSRNLTGTGDQAGDASLAGDILQAKRDKDFAAFFEKHPDLLADGGTIPTNWGQFRKAFSNKKNNLGVVVSGHENDQNSSQQSEHGNGKDNGNGQDNDNGQGKDNNNGKGKGHNKP